MITVEEAQKKVLDNVDKTKLSAITIDSSYGHVLGKDVISPVDLPLFTKSAMDGYAVQYDDLQRGKLKLEVIDEIQAGSVSQKIITPGTCMRIFTGASVPEGADTIVIQEIVHEVDQVISIHGKPPERGANLRYRGEQIKKGEVALKKDVLINPAAVGFLASMGLQSVEVYRKPKVSIVVTGNELQQKGGNLAQGMIYESNSLTINACLQQMRIEAENEKLVLDEKDKLQMVLSRRIHVADVLIITGGISVGKYDFVKECLEDLGTEEVFYKVAQKPGKPLYFGINQGTCIFALPGNPASVLSCFYQYIYPALRKMMGYQKVTLERKQYALTQEIRKSNLRAQFFKAKVEENRVTPLSGQQSHMMQSFAEANGLIYLSKETVKASEGDLVEVDLIPDNM